LLTQTDAINCTRGQGKDQTFKIRALIENTILLSDELCGEVKTYLPLKMGIKGKDIFYSQAVHNRKIT
jgi:hypothetical protein